MPFFPRLQRIEPWDPLGLGTCDPMFRETLRDVYLLADMLNTPGTERDKHRFVFKMQQVLTVARRQLGRMPAQMRAQHLKLVPESMRHMFLPPSELSGLAGDDDDGSEEMAADAMRFHLEVQAIGELERRIEALLGDLDLGPAEDVEEIEHLLLTTRRRLLVRVHNARKRLARMGRESRKTAWNAVPSHLRPLFDDTVIL